MLKEVTENALFFSFSSSDLSVKSLSQMSVSHSSQIEWNVVSSAPGDRLLPESDSSGINLGDLEDECTQYKHSLFCFHISYPFTFLTFRLFCHGLLWRHLRFNAKKRGLLFYGVKSSDTLSSSKSNLQEVNTSAWLPPIKVRIVLRILIKWRPFYLRSSSSLHLVFVFFEPTWFSRIINNTEESPGSQNVARNKFWLQDRILPEY